MQFEYQQTKKDYTDFYKAYYQDGLKKRKLIIIALLLIAISTFGREPFEWSRLLIGMLASILFIVVIFYFIPLLRSFRVLDKTLAKESSAFDKKKLTTTDEGLLIESENSTKTWNWESIVSINVLDNFIYLVLSDKRMLLFPKRHFQADTDTSNFLGLIKSKIIHFPVSHKMPFTRIYSKPNYWPILLCLIPIGGVFAGIIFLVLGFTKYKDKWYIALGALGLAWAISFVVIISKTDIMGFQTETAKFSQKQINAVMGEVEFYKLKNGVYPDSLGQLTKNSSVWIWDPLGPDGKVGKNNEFNYQRVGNHYYLFSSGIDRIPGNADDIYPEVSKSDSGKFGLIHK